jgi:Protein of unknown function (DUF3800)
MRIVYMDEAGTSAHEPVTIVVGIIVHAEMQLDLARYAVKVPLTAVPEPLREHFLFHATDIWNNHQIREKWSVSERGRCLGMMMSIPRIMELPIAWAAVARDKVPYSPELLKQLRCRSAQVDQMRALHFCLGEVGRYMRDHTGFDEKAIVIGEDVPEMRKLLLRTFDVAKVYSVAGPGGERRVIPSVMGTTRTTNIADLEIEVTRVESLRFVPKADDPLLQVADACAFGLRRYFSAKKFGTELATYIFGTLPDADLPVPLLQYGLSWFGPPPVRHPS